MELLLGAGLFASGALFMVLVINSLNGNECPDNDYSNVTITTEKPETETEKIRKDDEEKDEGFYN